MKRTKEKKKNGWYTWANYKKKQKKYLTNILVGLILITFTLTIYLFVQAKRMNIAVVPHVFAVLSNFVSIIGLIFISLQIIDMRVTSDKQFELEIKKNTLSIMNDFSKLITDHTAIMNVFEGESRWSTLIESRTYTDYRNFNISEFNELFKSDDDRAFLRNGVSSIYADNNKKIIVNYGLQINVCSDLAKKYHRFCQVSNWDQKIIDEEFSKFERYTITNDATDYFEKDLIDFLNKMEHFAANFNSGLIEENIAFRSMHQLFLRTIKSLYPVIANTNSDSQHGQYYQHIINLYKKWSNKNEFDKDEREKAANSVDPIDDGF